MQVQLCFQMRSRFFILRFRLRPLRGEPTSALLPATVSFFPFVFFPLC